MRARATAALSLMALCAGVREAQGQTLDSLVVRLAAMSAVTGFEDAVAESLLAALRDLVALADLTQAIAERW